MRSAGRLVAVVLLCVCAVTLSGCSTDGAHDGGPDPSLRGQWMLVSAHADSRALSVRGQDITLTIGAGDKAIGRSSCYDYTATIYGSRNSLWVAPQHPVVTACTSNGQQDLDSNYFGALLGVRRFVSDGKSLELSGPGVRLEYTTVVNPSLRGLFDWQWKLVGESVLDGAPTRHPFFSQSGAVVLFGSTGLITAETPCVQFIASFHQSAGVIVTTDISTATKAECLSLPQRPDAQLVSALISGFTVSINTNDMGTMTLISYRAGIALKFVPDLDS